MKKLLKDTCVTFTLWLGLMMVSEDFLYFSWEIIGEGSEQLGFFNLYMFCMILTGFAKYMSEHIITKENIGKVKTKINIFKKLTKETA